MGAIGYATQSGLYFNALERMDASLLALILYVYPALVLIGAVALGRERASVRRVAALLIALAGTALVLAGAASGSLDALGTAMGFGAALAYTVYILTGDRVGAGVPPVALAAFVCLGATCTFALASVVRGGPELGFGAAGWAWVGAIAVVSTVAAILCFFAGLARVGPSAASILSTLEPLVTVALAAAAFGESLGAVQLVGGALVLGAVLVMQWPARGRRTAHAAGRAAASWCSIESSAAPPPQNACCARPARQLERDREVGRERVPLADVADERAVAVLPDHEPRHRRAEEVAPMGGQLEQDARRRARRGARARRAPPRPGSPAIVCGVVVQTGRRDVAAREHRRARRGVGHDLDLERLARGGRRSRSAVKRPSAQPKSGQRDFQVPRAAPRSSPSADGSGTGG